MNQRRVRIGIIMECRNLKFRRKKRYSL